MSENRDKMPIQYYELMNIKQILEIYTKNADSPILLACYSEALDNIKKILNSF